VLNDVNTWLAIIGSCAALITYFGGWIWWAANLTSSLANLTSSHGEVKTKLNGLPREVAILENKFENVSKNMDKLEKENNEEHKDFERRVGGLEQRSIRT
jgi:peptidoglycan hydrolase CwlO-like protein